MKIHKLYEFLETQVQSEIKSDIKISQNVYNTYYEEFKKSSDIWQALEDTAETLDMSENDVYNHIVNLGEGSMFEKLNEAYDLLTEDIKFDKILIELSYQRKTFEKRFDKIEKRLEETIQNVNTTNKFLVEIIHLNNLKTK